MCARKYSHCFFCSVMKLRNCGFRLVQQRVCRCYCISDMMEMLIALTLRNCLLNLAFRHGGVTDVCCEERLHRRKRPAAVWGPSFQQLVDSFLGLPVPSHVLQRERGLERQEGGHKLLGIAHHGKRFFVLPLVKQIDSDSVAN